MSKAAFYSCLAYVAGFCVSASASAFMPPSHAPWIKRSDNKIYAQAVVDQIMATTPDLVAIGLHSIPPGVKAAPNDPGQVVIAQVEDIIGRPDVAADLEVGKLEQVRIYRGPLAGIPRMRVFSPLYDGAGRNIGLAVFVFKIDSRTTALSTHVEADAILHRLARDFPDQASLFRSVP